MNQVNTIGKVAAAAGVNVETIRYYQRRGLITEPPKTMGGFRHYDQTTVDRVRFIKRAQALGFSLEEIAGLLKLQQSNACQQTHDMAVQKLKLVEDRIKDLIHIRNSLEQLVRQCEKGTNSIACPIIASFSQD